LSNALDKIKQWLRRSAASAEKLAERGPVATPPGDMDRETSTNAQTEGASGEPWSDDE